MKTSPSTSRHATGVRLLPLLTFILALFFNAFSAAPALAATQIDILGPPGSGSFGKVTVLTNGNFVVVDTGYDAGAILNVGAVHLYNGATGSLIATLTGSTANDQIGSGGVTALSNGNYVVGSPQWDQLSPATTDVGAATWCSGTTGCSGTVSSSNSLIGTTAGDQVSGIMSFFTSNGIVPLSNGNYVVNSQNWDQPSPLVANVGAITWCSGASGCTGPVSSSNSLTGSTANDQVGNLMSLFSNIGIAPLSNGNYVVNSPHWDQPSPLAVDVGAVTWCDGTIGCTGVVSSANSLTGSTANDQVGSIVSSSVANGIMTLNNGNYVINSQNWDQPSPLVVNVGAVTWCDGTIGCTGVVSSSNSLTGSTAGDQVGSNLVTTLSNGNYVVGSNFWDQPSPPVSDVGAVTWCSGTTGCTGVVSSSNSLTGSTNNDNLGYEGIMPLRNGNYVVRSPQWDQPSPLVSDVGAVTWCDGTSGCTGAVSSANSLLGGRSGDNVGSFGVIPLSNGNYVVNSPNWDQPSPLVSNVGAATWCDGTSGCTGAVSSANSLIGSTANDSVSGGGVKALSNGNYVVGSLNWDQPSPLVSDVGAVTWCSGTGGCIGIVSSANSLIGSTGSDQLGLVTGLTNGHYVVTSQFWDQPSPPVSNVGAATWCDGTSGCTGVISSANSLIGSTANNNVGSAVAPLSNGNYLVISTQWDQPSPLVLDVGALTWCDGTSGCTGAVSSANSLVGSTASDQIGGWIALMYNGNYLVSSQFWDQPSPLVSDVGAVSLCDGGLGCSGPITAANSVRGTAAGGGAIQNITYNPTHNWLVVGRPADNIVSLFRLSDASAPSVTGFTATSPSASLNIPITAFTAADDTGVTGFLITQSATPPLASDPGWSSSAPTTYTVVGDGTYTLYPWAKDAAGNISALFGSPATVMVDTVPPPAPVIVTPPDGTITSDSTPSITGTAEPSRIITISIDGASAGTTSADASGNWSFTPVSALAEGPHAIVATTTDPNGNAIALSNTNNISVDSIAPTVTINQAAGQNDPATIGPINFMVTFSEPVSDFDDGADVLISGTAGATTAAITGSGAIYNVAISGMTTAETIVVTIPAGAARDQAVNPSAPSTSTDNTVTFAPVVPIVTGIVRANPDPTNAASVQFTVSFSNDVSGVDAEDFSLVTNGISGASITSVSGSGTTLVVTVSTGSGSGTIGLNLVDDDSIVDGTGTPLGGAGGGNGSFTSGEVYTIDKTAPTAESLLAANISTGGGTTHSFTVAFSDSLEIDIASLDDFDIRVTGPGGFSQLATLVSVTPATHDAPLTATYQVSAPGGSWDSADNGAYSIALEADQVQDSAGNTVTASTLGSFTVNIAASGYTIYMPLVVQLAEQGSAGSINPDRSRFTLVDLR